MTKAYKEELAVIKEQLKQNIKEHSKFGETLNVIDSKLDVVIDTKADKEEVQILNNRIWTITIFILTAMATFIGVLISMR